MIVFGLTPDSLYQTIPSGFADRDFQFADFGWRSRAARRESSSQAKNCAAQNGLSSSSHLNRLDRIPTRGK